jgi:hypothetical protein
MEDANSQMSKTEASLWQRNYRYVVDHWIVFLIMFAGAVASIYFGFWPKSPHRELTYAIQPVRTAIVQVNQASDIGVTYKGKPIRGDLSAAQIMIGNAGQEGIEASDIVTPITLVISNAEILECSFGTPALQGTQFILATNLPTNHLNMQWKLLEKGDNPVIQIVYAGNRNASISLEGRIKGQGALKQVSWPNDSKPRWQVIAWYVIGCMVILIQILSLWQYKNAKLDIQRYRWLMITCFLVGVVGAVLYKHLFVGY